METINRFNLRVYALCIKDNKVLSLFEHYAGDKLIKFPGGGLEFGEGLTDCLHREFREELNVSIKVLEHFYTQDGFVKSRFRDNEQLVTVYYLVRIVDLPDLKILEDGIDNIKWIPIDGPSPYNLPVDQIVFQKLKDRFLSK